MVTWCQYTDPGLWLALAQSLRYFVVVGELDSSQSRTLLENSVPKRPDKIVRVVPYIDLKAQYRALKPEIDAAVLKVLETGEFILGSEVARFEEEFAAYCGADYAIGVNS